MGNEFVLADAPESDFVKWEALPAGLFLLADVTDVTVRDSFYNVDDDKPELGKKKEVNFKFTIVDDEHPEYNGRVIFGKTPTTFTNHENCKLRKWVEEIFAFDELPVGFQLDTEDLIGQYVKVIVGNRPGKDKQNNPVVKDFVDGLIRAAAYESSADSF